MRLFTKILFTTCFLVQLHSSQAEVFLPVTPPDAVAESQGVVGKLKDLFKKHGESVALKMLNGLEGNRNDMTMLEVEEAFGRSPVLCVEKNKEGKLIVVATRSGDLELNTDLTADKTHREVENQLKTKESTVVYYTDKTGRHFELMAVSYKYLEEESGTAEKKPEDRCFYCATEKQVVEIPSSAIIVK
jgi:hypothetical protein